MANVLTKKTKTRPPLKREMVASKIRSMILKGSLKVGDSLPTEEELAKRFGVSRICIREATKALSLVGILKSTRRWGTIVGNDEDSERFYDYASLQFAVNGHSQADFLEARLVIECGVLPIVTELMAADESLYGHLRAKADDMKNAMADPLKALRCDFAFHVALVRASGNRSLMSFSRILLTFFHQILKDRIAKDKLGTGAALERVCDDHHRILDALSAGNVALAEGVLREHLVRHREH